MFLIVEVHPLDVLPIFVVFVLVVGTDDDGTEPGGGGEFQDHVDAVFPLGLVLLKRGFGHVGAAILHFADRFGCEGAFEEGGHGWRSQLPVAVEWE